MFFNVYACFFYHEKHEVQEDIRDLNSVSIMTFMVNERILLICDLHYFYIVFEEKYFFRDRGISVKSVRYALHS